MSQCAVSGCAPQAFMHMEYMRPESAKCPWFYPLEFDARRARGDADCLMPSAALPSDATLPPDAALPSAATWRRVAHAVRASRLLSRPVSTSAAGMLRAKVNAARLLRSALQRHTRLLSVAEPSSAPQAALRAAENATAMLASQTRAAGGGWSSAGGRGASLP